MKIQKAIKILRGYTEFDLCYKEYKENKERNFSDFDKFCIDVCQAIETIIDDYNRQVKINKEHQSINGELRKKIKKLEKVIDKIKN